MIRFAIRLAAAVAAAIITGSAVLAVTGTSVLAEIGANIVAVIVLVAVMAAIGRRVTAARKGGDLDAG